MPSSPTDFVSRGKVIAVQPDSVVFKPAGTNYEFNLKTSAPYSGPVNSPVEILIRVNARKVYTVPSGGNFVQPIVGPPKIIQGRVRHLDDRQLVVHASANFIVDLPGADTAIDLDNGLITLNTMVNVVALPGAAMELAAAVAKA